MIHTSSIPDHLLCWKSGALDAKNTTSVLQGAEDA
jgi:hypothetical protein